jgi:hypothetical protein
MFAIDSEQTRESLRGIKGVRVVVEDVSADAVRDGLTRDQIQTDVELRLRKAGINVVNNTPAARAILSIYAHLLKANGNLGYIYNCDVHLAQLVTANANGVSVVATTWSTGMLGGVESSNMPRTIRDNIGDLVDDFLNAYLSVNPK